MGRWPDAQLAWGRRANRNSKARDNIAGAKILIEDLYVSPTRTSCQRTLRVPGPWPVYGVCRKDTNPSGNVSAHGNRTKTPAGSFEIRRTLPFRMQIVLHMRTCCPGHKRKAISWLLTLFHALYMQNLEEFATFRAIGLLTARAARGVPLWVQESRAPC